MIRTEPSPVVDVFRQYVDLYQLRNSGEELEPEQEKDWKEISFTMESIFSGMYRPDPDQLFASPADNATLREQLPVEFLRVPTETDVLCETMNSFFSGRLQDISTGGAYVHAKVHSSQTAKSDSPSALSGTRCPWSWKAELPGAIPAA